LFILQEKQSENFIKIVPPKNSDFEFPDDEAKLEPYKHGDFNADGKQDILVYLGACGTGGCMYGLFLNQSDNYYKLAFMDYLKNPKFITEKTVCGPSNRPKNWNLIILQKFRLPLLNLITKPINTS